MMQTTLGYLVRKNSESGKREITLSRKARGHGVNKWNGFGGKVQTDKNESILDGFIRETGEEINCIPTKIKSMGKIKFTFDHLEGVDQVVHIFICEEWEGIPGNSEEMQELKWHPIDELPFNEMWPTDIKWLPNMLNGEKINLDIHFFDELDYEIKNLENPELDIK